MIDIIFTVFFISGVFNFLYIWFFAKTENVCKRLLRISSIFFLPRVIQSFYNFILEGFTFSSTILIILEFSFNLIATSCMISFITLSITGALDDIFIKRLKEREK